MLFTEMFKLDFLKLKKIIQENYMRIKFTILLLAVFSFCYFTVSTDLSATQVVPPAYTASTGTATFLGPLANTSRTYQLLINANQLTGMIGQNLTAISWRSLASATTVWPPTDYTISSYRIYLSESVTPSARSLALFSANVVGPQTLVRSGSLLIPDSTYTIGSSPNQFGPEITFDIPYYYAGGHLLIEIRQTGFTGTSRSVDAISTTTSGYGTDFSGCWKSGDTATFNALQANFSVVKLSAQSTTTLNLQALIEGRYNDVTNLMVSDTTKVLLHSGISPYPVVDSAVSVLNSDGKGTFNFSNAVSGVGYYIVVNHRNSIETWSANPMTFISDTLSYDFTTAATTAYGNNLFLKGSRWTIYSGDINKDGFVDLTDLSLAYNDATLFVTGYAITDVNGDLFSDLFDVLIVYANSSKFIGVAKP